MSLKCPVFPEDRGITMSLLSWGRILGRSPDKILRVFFHAIHSHLYSFALRFLLLPTHEGSNSFPVFTVQSLHTVKQKGGNPDKQPFPLPYGLRNPYRNLKSENSQDYAQKPQWNCSFMNSPSAWTDRLTIYEYLWNWKCPFGAGDVVLTIYKLGMSLIGGHIFASRSLMEVSLDLGSSLGYSFTGVYASRSRLRFFTCKPQIWILRYGLGYHVNCIRRKQPQTWAGSLRWTLLS
jgi:hypothetical protein